MLAPSTYDMKEKTQISVRLVKILPSRLHEIHHIADSTRI